MSVEIEPTSSVAFTRFKFGIMIEVYEPGNDDFFPPFGVSFNNESDVQAWHCLLEWFAVDEEHLKWNGERQARNTNLPLAELIDLIASSWMIEDLIRQTGLHNNYITSLMSKIRLSK